jgi:broad specificity phosphatase PhoE
MRLVLVRHGRPDEGHAQRPHDPPLHADGHLQARCVAALLSGEGVTRIVSSPLLRARETAEPLAERLGLSIDTLDGFAEADRHLDRYRSIDTLKALGEAEWQRFRADPVAYLGGDSARFRAEVLDALQSVITAGGACVAVFTHGLPINVVLSSALGLDGLVHFSPGYGSVTRLHALAGGRTAVISVNELAQHAASLGPQVGEAPP